MEYKNQSGFAHLALMLIVLTLSLVTFTGLKVASSSKKSLKPTQSSVTEQKPASKNKTVAPAPDATIENMNKPADENTAQAPISKTPAPATTQVVASKPTQAQSAAPAPTKPQQVKTSYAAIFATPVYVEVNGDTSQSYISAYANTSDNLRGTCYFDFIKDGVVRLQKSAVTDSNGQCEATPRLSEFPKNGDYTVRITFYTSNNSHFADETTSFNFR